MKSLIASIFALPVAFASTAAVAQEGAHADQQTSDAAKDASKTDETRTQKHQKKTSKDAQKDTQKKGARDKGVFDADTSVPETTPPGTKTREVGGQKIEQKDKDVDLAIGETQTTAAEPQATPRRDVVESRDEALREREGRRIYAAPLFGYGTNDFNVGLGARAGYTLDNNVYVGGTFLYHFGSDDRIVGPAGITETNSYLLYPGVEAGYDIGIGPVLVRPYGGAGLLFATSSVKTNSVEAKNTDSAFMLWPGINAQYIIANTPVFVGGDIRLLLPFENVDPSVTFLATAGLRL